ncbi:MAG: nicotinate phosphoribosyltransferase [Acidobacteriota bacterium]|nr:nicotinate phosphoribosyltransferase [Acidobacteriota bacterium]
MAAIPPGRALATDLYELTMMAGYLAGGMTGQSSFELYVRSLPARRAYLVAAGLEQALDYLESLAFTPDQIAYLRTVPALKDVPDTFFTRDLPAFRFTGEVWAVAEGTPVFAHEPILRVTAPAPEAQLVETALLAIITFQTSIATKGARVVDAAAGVPVIEFGSRRAHGLDAGLHAARAAFVAGCAGTSNVEAGFAFGIPVSGTMAHSWVMSFDDEVEAFRRYCDLFGHQAVLLIDTYDTEEAARRIVDAGLRPAAVRLDSGDFVALSVSVRRILDAGGLHDTGIFVSGDLDEDKIAALMKAKAPVNGFGVGTALSTSNDAPALGGVYKLVEVERDGQRVPVLKLSAGKRTYPARKQVWRIVRDGRAQHDLIGLAGEPAPDEGRPLLTQVMRGGRRVAPSPPLPAVQEACRAARAELPPELRELDAAPDYPVEISPTLNALTERISEAIEGERSR